MSQNRSTAVMQRRVEAHEQWREIEGWSGYEVSDHGRVRSWKRPSAGRVWSIDRSKPARILRPNLRNGYPSVVLSDRSAGRKWESVHRLVLTAFVGPCPAGWHGAHGDGDTTSNALGNLRWATPAENNGDKRAHGTLLNGERVGTAKLSRGDVTEIVARRAAGEAVAGIAAAFGVCRNTVTNITRGHSWKGDAHGAE